MRPPSVPECPPPPVTIFSYGTSQIQACIHPWDHWHTSCDCLPHPSVCVCVCGGGLPYVNRWSIPIVTDITLYQPESWLLITALQLNKSQREPWTTFSSSSRLPITTQTVHLYKSSLECKSIKSVRSDVIYYRESLIPCNLVISSPSGNSQAKCTQALPEYSPERNRFQSSQVNVGEKMLTYSTIVRTIPMESCLAVVYIVASQKKTSVCFTCTI